MVAYCGTINSEKTNLYQEHSLLSVHSWVRLCVADFQKRSQENEFSSCTRSIQIQPLEIQRNKILLTEPKR